MEREKQRECVCVREREIICVCVYVYLYVWFYRDTQVRSNQPFPKKSSSAADVNPLQTCINIAKVHGWQFYKLTSHFPHTTSRSSPTPPTFILPRKKKIILQVCRLVVHYMHHSSSVTFSPWLSSCLICCTKIIIAYSSLTKSFLQDQLHPVINKKKNELK
jgi:hypothetical protein